MGESYIHIWWLWNTLCSCTGIETTFISVELYWSALLKVQSGKGRWDLSTDGCDLINKHVCCLKLSTQFVLLLCHTLILFSLRILDKCFKAFTQMLLKKSPNNNRKELSLLFLFCSPLLACYLVPTLHPGRAPKWIISLVVGMTLVWP